MWGLPYKVADSLYKVADYSLYKVADSLYKVADSLYKVADSLYKVAGQSSSLLKLQLSHQCAPYKVAKLRHTRWQSC